MTHYNTLQVSRHDTIAVIKKAYKRLARTYHPDKGGSAEQFRQIKESYDVLSDPTSRAQYDAQFQAEDLRYEQARRRQMEEQLRQQREQQWREEQEQERWRQMEMERQRAQALREQEARDRLRRQQQEQQEREEQERQHQEQIRLEQLWYEERLQEEERQRQASAQREEERKELYRAQSVADCEQRRKDKIFAEQLQAEYDAPMDMGDASTPTQGRRKVTRSGKWAEQQHKRREREQAQEQERQRNEPHPEEGYTAFTPRQESWQARVVQDQQRMLEQKEQQRRFNPHQPFVFRQ